MNCVWPEKWVGARRPLYVGAVAFEWNLVFNYSWPTCYPLVASNLEDR